MNATNINMSKDNQKLSLELSAERKAAVETWFKKLEEHSLFNPRNSDIGINTIQASLRNQTPLPLILTLCPAIENLNSPNLKGQTRKLVILDKNLPRARVAVEEIFGFLISLRKSLGIRPNIFLIFSDSLERGAESMFENARDMEQIATASVNGIQDLFKEFDQKHQGLLQQFSVEVPKIRRQSTLNTQGGKAGINRDWLIEEKEAEMLDPLNPLFALWQKHLLITRNDDTFVSTGWQNKKGAEALWNRVRFLLAEFITDGEFLPKMNKVLNPKKFTDTDIPRPIFLASSTRAGGFEMEVDGFNVSQQTCVTAPFHNIGRWTEPPHDSPWINELIPL